MHEFIHTFVVSGGSSFPWDMLRYDHCTLADPAQVALAASDGPRDVVLRARGQGAHWTPTRGRWRSFSWDVKAHHAPVRQNPPDQHVWLVHVHDRPDQDTGERPGLDEVLTFFSQVTVVQKQDAYNLLTLWVAGEVGDLNDILRAVDKLGRRHPQTTPEVNTLDGRPVRQTGAAPGQ